MHFKKWQLWNGDCLYERNHSQFLQAWTDQKDRFSICGQASINLFSVACCSTSPSGNCLRWSHGWQLYSRKLCLLPSDSGGDGLGCCHYSDRQDGKPTECPPQRGNQWWVVELRDNAAPLWFSGDIDKSQILQPTHQSAGGCLLCIIRCELNINKPRLAAFLHWFGSIHTPAELDCASLCLTTLSQTWYLALWNPTLCNAVFPRGPSVASFPSGTLLN